MTIIRRWNILKAVGDKEQNMNRFIWLIIKKLITLMWKRERFLVYSWGVDEHVDINVITEESYLDRHRFGLREEKIYKEQEHE